MYRDSESVKMSRKLAKLAHSTTVASRHKLNIYKDLEAKQLANGL